MKKTNDIFKNPSTVATIIAITEKEGKAAAEIQSREEPNGEIHCVKIALSSEQVDKITKVIMEEEN